MYCSPEHRRLYGHAGRKPKPPIKKVCLGCGEEFVLPGWKMNEGRKYCSNECAKREQKKGWGKVGVQVHDGVLVLRSMYELRFVAVCERRGWEWRNFDGAAFQTRHGNYRPDFIVNGRIVEVKGWVTPAVHEKIEDSGRDVWLVDEAELVRLEEGGEE